MVGWPAIKKNSQRIWKNDYPIVKGQLKNRKIHIVIVKEQLAKVKEPLATAKWQLAIAKVQLAARTTGACERDNVNKSLVKALQNILQIVNNILRYKVSNINLWKFIYWVNTSGGLSQDFAGSFQNRVTAKTKFEPGRVTAQRVILLLPSLINNIYFVICIGLIPSWHLILAP